MMDWPTFLFGFTVGVLFYIMVDMEDDIKNMKLWKKLRALNPALSAILLLGITAIVGLFLWYVLWYIKAGLESFFRSLF